LLDTLACLTLAVVATLALLFALARLALARVASTRVARTRLVLNRSTLALLLALACLALAVDAALALLFALARLTAARLAFTRLVLRTALLLLGTAGGRLLAASTHLCYSVVVRTRRTQYEPSQRLFGRSHDTGCGFIYLSR